MITKKDIEENISLYNKSLLETEVVVSQVLLSHTHISILYFLREIMEDRCENYLEIGSFHGGSMLTAMRSKYQCNFYGIEIFSDRLNKEMTPDKLNDQISKNNINEHHFEIIKGDSLDNTTISTVKQKIVEESVGIFFIDGLHTTHAVQNDFDNYISLVKPGGFIVFDDYQYAPVKHAVNNIVRNIDKSKFNVIGNIDNVNKSYDNGHTKTISDKSFEFIIQRYDWN